MVIKYLTLIGELSKHNMSAEQEKSKKQESQPLNPWPFSILKDPMIYPIEQPYFYQEYRNASHTQIACLEAREGLDVTESLITAERDEGLPFWRIYQIKAVSHFRRAERYLKEARKSEDVQSIQRSIDGWNNQLSRGHAEIWAIIQPTRDLHLTRDQIMEILDIVPRA